MDYSFKVLGDFDDFTRGKIHMKRQKFLPRIFYTGRL